MNGTSVNRCICCFELMTAKPPMEVLSMGNTRVSTEDLGRLACLCCANDRNESNTLDSAKRWTRAGTAGFLRYKTFAASERSTISATSFLSGTSWLGVHCLSWTNKSNSCLRDAGSLRLDHACCICGDIFFRDPGGCCCCPAIRRTDGWFQPKKRDGHKPLSSQ